MVHDGSSGAPTQERAGDGDRPGDRGEKKLIERAYREGERLGLAVWCEDEAGPYPTRPYPGGRWAEAGQAHRQPHEYLRNGTAKLLSLFHPASGQVRAHGVIRALNALLHPWLKQELTAILATLPPPTPVTDPSVNRARWAQCQAGLSQPITLPPDLPALRMLLVLDNLTGHKTPAWVLWLVAHGIMPVVHPTQRLLAQQGRVHSAHPGAPSTGGSVSSDDTHADHRLAGSDGAGLEPSADAL